MKHFIQDTGGNGENRTKFTEYHDIIYLDTGCSKTVQNGYLINCKSNAGDTCRYECNSPMETNPSIPNIACGTNGDWNHDTNDLCGEHTLLFKTQPDK